MSEQKLAMPEREAALTQEEPSLDISEIYQGLRSISDRSFPKTCPTCGKTYETVEVFLAETERLRNSTGFKSSLDDEDKPIVELFRNCTCGSTLLETFGDRRDNSPKGIKARENFGRILKMLISDGNDPKKSRDELLKLTRGEGSAFISDWFAQKKLAKAQKKMADEKKENEKVLTSGT